MIDHKKLFGTDGIRGEAMIHPITAEFMLRLGTACGQIIRAAHNKANNLVVIGNDTRQSCCMLQIPLAAGIVSQGIDVQIIGCMPSPAVAMALQFYNASCGIMISSSHNAADTNGVKFFNDLGYKFSSAQELEIETALQLLPDPPIVATAFNGKYQSSLPLSTENNYVECLKKLLHGNNLANMRIVIDCANGATSDLAHRVFTELGATVHIINNTPNGSNINDKCGVLHASQNICLEVSRVGADIGIAFDGDGDRMAICDEKGNLIDGDLLIGYLAVNLKKEKRLNESGVAFTKLSNMGLSHFLARHGVNTFISDIGERRVVDLMLENDLGLGGEKSGHIIMKHHCNTSDGMAAALQILSFLKDSSQPASKQFTAFELYPQVFKNISNKNRIGTAVLHSTATMECMRKVQDYIGRDGRILARESGTEDVIRLMVECKDMERAGKAMQMLATYIESAMEQGISG